MTPVVVVVVGAEKHPESRGGTFRASQWHLIANGYYIYLFRRCRRRQVEGLRGAFSGG